MTPPPPTSTLFPYTTLFRSGVVSGVEIDSSLGLVYGIRFPTDEEEELLRRFTVVLNHVDNMRMWLESEYGAAGQPLYRSEEHTSELQSHSDLVCRLLLEKKK